MDYIDVEGVILPNTPLSNVEIDDAVKQLNIPNFRGCYCINMLPKEMLKSECGILNLDNSRGDGTHWQHGLEWDKPVSAIMIRRYTSTVMDYNHR